MLCTSVVGKCYKSSRQHSSREPTRASCPPSITIHHTTAVETVLYCIHSNSNLIISLQGTFLFIAEFHIA